MYRPPAYAVDDREQLHAAIRARRFATIAGLVSGTVQFAYAPVVVDPGTGAHGTLRFHLANSNPLAALDGGEVRLSFLGPDAYISPDWYVTPSLVPTWNYIAVEASGRLRMLDNENVRRLLVDLSAAEEDRLAPKPRWTLDKLSEERLVVLTSAIRGFEVTLETLQGKFKLSQDKRENDAKGAIAGLEAHGDPASVAVAAEMRRAANVRR